MSNGYKVQGAGAGAGYRLDRAEAVLLGRWKEVLATAFVAVLLFVIQQPMRQVASGKWDSEYTIDPIVPIRLSLLVDLVLIVAYVLLAYRLFGLVRCLRPSDWVRRMCALGTSLIVVGAALDVVEDGILWFADGDLSVPFTNLMRGLLGFGLLIELVALGLAFRAFRKRGSRAADPGAPPPVAPAPDDPAGIIISCSGGGIRSAAFSLGGLQVLTDKGIYQDASHVVGVSGGGYIGAAHHVLRWRSEDAAGEQWPDLGAPPPFDPSSPELQWLRRHTRYVLNSVSVATRGGLSLAFGIGVNLLLVTIALGASAWLLAWLWLASGEIDVVDVVVVDTIALPDLTSALSIRFDGNYARGWRWLEYVWLIPVAGAGLFVAEEAVNRFWTPGRKFNSAVRIATVALLWGGGLATAVLLGVPWLLETLNRYAATSDSDLARLIHQLGLIPDGFCAIAAADGGPACGVAKYNSQSSAPTSTFAVTSVATIIGSILAVLASFKAAVGGTTDRASAIGTLLAKVWTKVKAFVIPWLAAVLIVIVLVVLLLRWVAALTEDPSLLERWDLAYIFGAALLACFVFTEPNRTSMHHFFRERISYAFLVRRGARAITPVDYTEPLRFSRSSPPDGRGPELVTCAVANVSDEQLVPSKRDCTPFIFDSQHIGLTDRLLPDDAGRRPSAAYEFAADHRYRDATIPAAIAMSAAAFSPLVGRENVRLGPYRAVLALANARLGVWLPNPLWMDEEKITRRLRRMGRDLQGNPLADRQRRAALWRFAENIRNAFKKPGFSRLAKEAFGKTSAFDRFLYVTDGGHYDNLGLIEALRRRPAHIYVMDASNDPEDTFRALGKAIASARMDLDCEVSIDPIGMRRIEQGRAAAAWCVGTATYSDGKTAKIFMIKAIMLDGLPWDVETYASDNVDFPRTSTNNQLYSEFDFEAYRSLGSQTMSRLLTSKEYRAAISDER